jgi:hypothetical protein
MFFLRAGSHSIQGRFEFAVGIRDQKSDHDEHAVQAGRSIDRADPAGCGF